MTNIIKSLRFFILFVFSYSSLSSSPTSDVLLKIAAQHDVHGDSGVLGLASDAFKQMLENLNGLDFYTSTSLSIAVPGTDKVVVYDWKEAGSGDIFTPFTTIKPIIKPVAGEAVAYQKFSVTDLGKILIENELFKKGKKLSLIKDYVELTPLRLFTLKMALLAKYAYVNNDAAVIAGEVVRMLIKLSLVDDMKLLDPSKKLSSYMPEVVIESLGSVCPGLIESLDEVWMCMMTEQPDQLVIPVQAQAYLFKDAALADECFSLVQGKDSNTFVSLVEEFVAQKKCQLCSYADVKKFKGTPLNIMTKRLVGKLNSSNVLADEELSSLLQPELTQHNECTFRLVQRDAGGDEYWIISLSDELGFFQTLKQLVRVLVKSVKQLVIAKKEFSKNNPDHIELDLPVNIISETIVQDVALAARQLTELTSQLAEKQTSILSWHAIQKEAHDADVDQIIRDLKHECEDLRKNIAYQHKVLSSLQHGQSLAAYVEKEHSFQEMVILGALRDIFVEFTSDIPQVAVLKKTLMNDFVKIVNHSQHIKENSDVYRYIIMTSFPEFLPSFDTAVVA